MLAATASAGTGGAPALSELQFEKAEYTGPEAPACGLCRQPLSGLYWQVGERVACESCKAGLELARTSGTSIGRFLRACVYGTAAGALGAALWYGVWAATGYQVGLIALVVGAMVGAAVRKGSGGRGGWRYQTLAVVLTYTSIVSTYVPLVLKEVLNQPGPGATASPAAASPGREAAASGDPTGVAVPAPRPAAPEPAAPQLDPVAGGAGPTAPPPESPGPGQLLLALVLFAVLVGAVAFAAPFLGGFENLIGIFIIGIGLWEAWKINRPVSGEISGPFRIGATGAEA